MTTFLQISALSNYGPSNLNRDESGRQKTISVGGTNRTRVSSQCHKRSWRTGPVFAALLGEHIGIRTRHIVRRTEELLSGQDDAKLVADISAAVAAISRGKAKPEKAKKGKAAKEPKVATDVAADEEEVAKGKDAMTLLGQHEIAALDELVMAAIASKVAPTPESVMDVISASGPSVDIAMFGRMLASHPELNTQAAVSVAHSYTVAPAAAEEDYFTAVDELLPETGSGHLGYGFLGAGVFYTYLSVNIDLLVANLGGDRELARIAVEALVRSVATVGPNGKKATHASHGRAAWMLVERGTEQPRQLDTAFLRAIRSDNVLEDAIAAVESTKERFTRVYSEKLESCGLNVQSGQGSLDDVVRFATEF